MNLAARDKTMFQTVFAPTREEVSALLDYIRFMWDQNVADQILAHPLYRPSQLWQQWAGQTFAGFSTEKILLQGGHALSSSVEVPSAAEPSGGSPWWRTLGILFGAKGKDCLRQGHDPVGVRQWFRGFYPHLGVCPEHERWYAWHPNPYFRCLEAYTLREKRSLPDRMMEIGGGACVNVAFYRSLNPALRTIVVDLPETIVFGFCFLKTVFPDLRITLPHQVQDALSGFTSDVQFLLPTQVDAIPDGSIDFCFNMSSFQEMEMITVNHYLRLFSRKLKPGGQLQSVNLETSRYIPDNTLKNYDFSDFHGLPSTKLAPFGTDLVRHVPNLRMVQVEVTKPAHA
jgi:hypothetical protein